MTYHELRAAHPRAFTALAVEFRAVAGRWGDRGTTAYRLGVQLARAWSGAAARAAHAGWQRLCQRFVATAMLVSRCDQLLAELCERLDRAQALLTEAEDLARQVGVHIDHDGRARPTITAAAATAPDPGLVQVCADVDRRIDTALRLATEADRDTAAQLAQLAVRLVHPPTPPSDVDIIAAGAGWPGPNAGAVQVAAYWRGLTPAQQWWLVANRPGLIGARDGIPAADRDVANRILLSSEQGRLLDRQRDTTIGAPPMIELAQIDQQLRGIQAIDTRLRDPRLPRAYLLSLSTVDDGRAVIAVHNPDQATDVVTCVPGAGTDLSGVDSLMRRAERLGDATRRLAPQHQVSVITWLGYDPPDGLAAVMAEAGHNAEPALVDFTDGLRVTHHGERSHNTVLGHSYGSLVAGVTARDRGLDADDLVFVGSPGVGVDRAAQLRLPAGHVWSSTAADDPVQRFAPGWGQLALTVLGNAASPIPTSYGDGEPDLYLWHGLNPSAAAFGATVFHSDPDGGHDGYWQGTALTALAHIAVAEPPP